MKRHLAMVRPAWPAILLGLALFIPTHASSSVDGGITDRDRTRLAELFRFADAMEDDVWPGWKGAPFSILLVTPETEFLVGWPEAPAGFDALGFDSTLQATVFARKRVFSTTLLATMSAIGRSPTIVTGTAEETGKSSTEWVLTLLHEHFHQLQMSDSMYFADVDRLDLAHGDSSGMWMLNYPFPYSTPDISREIQDLAGMLAFLLEKPAHPKWRVTADAFWTRYRSLDTLLAPGDYRYLSFQLWQEGVARYVELRAAEAAAGYLPTPKFIDLPDYEPFEAVAVNLRREIVDALKTMKLPRDRRIAFYPFGAGVALLLDRTQPNWKERYLSDKFFLEKY